MGLILRESCSDALTGAPVDSLVFEHWLAVSSSARRIISGLPGTVLTLWASIESIGRSTLTREMYALVSSLLSVL